MLVYFVGASAVSGGIGVGAAAVSPRRMTLLIVPNGLPKRSARLFDAFTGVPGTPFKVAVNATAPFEFVIGSVKAAYGSVAIPGTFDATPSWPKLLKVLPKLL